MSDLFGNLVGFPTRQLKCNFRRNVAEAATVPDRASEGIACMIAGWIVILALLCFLHESMGKKIKTCVHRIYLYFYIHVLAK